MNDISTVCFTHAIIYKLWVGKKYNVQYDNRNARMPKKKQKRQKPIEKGTLRDKKKTKCF